MAKIIIEIDGDECLARLLAGLPQIANSADSSKNILIKEGKRARGGAAKASCQCSLRDLVCKKEHTEEIMGALGQLLRNAKGETRRTGDALCMEQGERRLHAASHL